jgi:predicted membrane protein
MAFSSILAWGMYLFSKNNLIKVVLLAAIGLMTYVNLTTVSRTGLYGLLVGIALITFFYLLNANWQSRIIVITSLGSLIIVVAIAYTVFLNTSTLGSLVNRLYGLQENSQIRVDLITQSINISEQNPMGEGPEALLVASSLPHHSLHTMLLSGLGWFGYLSLIVLIYWCVKPLLRFNKNNADIFELQLSLLGVMLAIFIMGFGHSFLDTTWGTVLFWCALGLAATINKLDKDNLIAGETISQ